MPKGEFDERYRCTATSKTTGERCQRRAAPGAKVCTSHGGAARQVREAGERNRARAQAEEKIARLHLRRDVDADTALIEELCRTAGWIDYLETVVDGGNLTQWTGKDGGKPSVEVELLNWNRTHFERVAKTCKAVGIAEARVRLAEEQGRVLAEVVRQIVTGLGRDLADPEVRRVVEPALRLVPRAA